MDRNIQIYVQYKCKYTECLTVIVRSCEVVEQTKLTRKLYHFAIYFRNVGAITVRHPVYIICAYAYMYV